VKYLIKNLTSTRDIK